MAKKSAMPRATICFDCDLVLLLWRQDLSHGQEIGLAQLRRAGLTSETVFAVRSAAEAFVSRQLPNTAIRVEAIMLTSMRAVDDTLNADVQLRYLRDGKKNSATREGVDLPRGLEAALDNILFGRS